MQREFEGVIQKLANDVAQAEQLRQIGATDKIEQIYQHWIGGRYYFHLMTELQSSIGKGANFGDLLDDFEVGIVGLGRIRHVHSNSLLKKAIGSERGSIEERINQVTDGPYLYIDMLQLPPETIHRGSIHWYAETSQDMISTATILGNTTKARRIAALTIIDLKEQIYTLAPNVNTKTPLHALRVADIQAYRDRRTFVGALSGLGIIIIREAMINQDLTSFNEGFRHVRAATKIEPNPHRLATVSLWSYNAALIYPSRLQDRLEAMKNGTSGYSTAYLQDRDAALNATKQHFFRR